MNITSSKAQTPRHLHSSVHVRLVHLHNLWQPLSGLRSHDTNSLHPFDALHNVVQWDNQWALFHIAINELMGRKAIFNQPAIPILQDLSTLVPDDRYIAIRTCCSNASWVGGTFSYALVQVSSCKTHGDMRAGSAIQCYCMYLASHLRNIFPRFPCWLLLLTI